MNDTLSVLTMWAGWMAVVSLQVAAIALAVALVGPALRHAPASARCAMWMLVVFKAFVPPVVAAGFAPGTVGIVHLRDWCSVTLEIFADPIRASHGTGGAIVEGALSTSVRLPLAGMGGHVLAAVLGTLFAVWALGAALRLAEAAASQARLAREIARGRTVTDGPLAEALAAAARMVRVSRLPRLVLSADAETPFLCGLFRPTIVLPAALPGELTPEALRAVLAHELVHLRRNDVLQCWVQTLAAALLWFHPVIRMANERIALERELAVDEAVLAAQVAAPRGYAETLLLVAEREFAPMLLAPGFLGSSLTPAAELERRLLAVMEWAPCPPRRRAGAWATVALASLLLLPAAGPARLDHRTLAQPSLEASR